MSEYKVSIYLILDPSYVEIHDIIMDSLKDDLKTLYSCVQVNRAFCKLFVPILWRNPFKFVKKDHLINSELIGIRDLPTSRAYFKYHTFIKEFELNPLQKGMRLWTSTYLS